MPNNRIDKLYGERPLAAKELAGVRDRVNAWANSIPHHPYANLGNSITIIQATEKPTHAVLLVTSYERRCLMWNRVPYHNEPVPHVPVGEDQLDVWNIELPHLAVPGEGEHDVEQDIPLTETRTLVQCDSCGGSGEVGCNGCYGSGIEDCRNCNGRGYLHCYSCNGSGQIESRSSDNDYRPTYRNCHGCAGQGQTRCDTCHGNGEHRCFCCGGSGWLICGDCKGQGKFLHFFSVLQSKSTLGRSERVHHPATPYAWRCDFPTSPAVTVKGKELWGADRLSTPVSELNDAIRSLLTASEQPRDCEYGVVGRELRTIGWVLQISRIPHFEVNYSFNGQRFNIWLHGSQERVHAPKSPISDVRDGYLAEARKFHKQGGPARVDALIAINKVAAMGNLSRQENNLRNKILLAVQFPYYIGGLVAGLGSVAAIEYFQPPFVWWKLCLAAIYGWVVGGALFKRTFLVIRKPLAGFGSASALAAGAAMIAVFAPYWTTAVCVSALLMALAIKGGDEKPSPPKDPPARSSKPGVAADTNETEGSDSESDRSEDGAASHDGKHEDEARDSEPKTDSNEARDTVETIWARSVLGVSADASEAEITSAYRHKMIAYHPDKVAHLAQEYRDIAEQKSKDLNKAREILKA
jgi:DnaJ domain